MNALEKAIKEINSKYKKELVRKGTDQIYVKRIRFTSPRMNYMTYGGIPVGKATELFGPENGGKTTTALDLVANAQKQALEEYEEAVEAIESKLYTLSQKEKLSKQDEKDVKKLEEELEQLQELGPEKVVYVDAENTLDVEWAQKLGVDTDSLILVRPDDETAEQVLQIVLDLIDTGRVLLLVLDSVPALVGAKVYDEDIGKQTYGGLGDVMAQFSGKVSGKLTRTMTALVVINQVREDMNNPHNMYKTPGGRALKHLFALRLYLRRGSFIDDRNEELKQSAAEPFGNLVDVTMIKTKVCKPDRRVNQYTLHYNTGVDVLGDTVHMAIRYDFIQQSGKWFYIVDPETGETKVDGDESLKFDGKANLLTYLRDNGEEFDELYESVNERLQQAH